jgi:tetratricopeptide (TPR) repeat protein
MTFRILLATLGLISITTLSAHPEIEVALAELNPGIALHPETAELWLRRATAYERHEDFALAEADLRQAVTLAPDSDETQLRLAGFLIGRERWAEARSPLTRAIALAPKNAEALVWRARLHRHLQDVDAALADYSRALSLLPEPPPELFLERADLSVAPEKILTGLDEGLARLGPVVALSDRAIALELQLGHTDAALARLDALTARAERKDALLKRRGDLLAASGRLPAARAAYLSALNELQGLPAWLRESADSVRLASDLQRLLRALSSS